MNGPADRPNSGRPSRGAAGPSTEPFEDRSDRGGVVGVDVVDVMATANLRVTDAARGRAATGAARVRIDGGAAVE